MANYKVMINCYSTAEVEVEANDYDEAREKALEKAETLDWGSYDRWYLSADENGNFDEIY